MQQSCSNIQKTFKENYIRVHDFNIFNKNAALFLVVRCKEIGSRKPPFARICYDIVLRSAARIFFSSREIMTCVSPNAVAVCCCVMLR